MCVLIQLVFCSMESRLLALQFLKIIHLFSDFIIPSDKQFPNMIFPDVTEKDTAIEVQVRGPQTICHLKNKMLSLVIHAGYEGGDIA